MGDDAIDADDADDDEYVEDHDYDERFDLDGNPVIRDASYRDIRSPLTVDMLRPPGEELERMQGCTTSAH